MRNTIRTLILFSVLPLSAIADDHWTPEQAAVLEAIDRLSAATAPGGGGADAYAESLAEGFSRWTVGSRVVNDRENWVKGVRDWFDAGWRVTEREVQILEITVHDDLATTRRIVREVYGGPDGETNESTAAVAEVWSRGSGRWLLLRADVHPMDE